MKKEMIVSKLENAKNSAKARAMGMWCTLAIANANMAVTYGAGSGTDKIDGFIDFACDWLLKIGGTVALVGGVMFALGWQREDAEGKTRGLQTMMAGFMLAAIAGSKGIFGL